MSLHWLQRIVPSFVQLSLPQVVLLPLSGNSSQLWSMDSIGTDIASGWRRCDQGLDQSRDDQANVIKTRTAYIYIHERRINIPISPAGGKQEQP